MLASEQLANLVLNVVLGEHVVVRAFWIAQSHVWIGRRHIAALWLSYAARILGSGRPRLTLVFHAVRAG
jgi:hypothetical protein